MLQINSLSISYGSHLALDNLNLSISSGEVVAIIGPNGAGKSTLVKAVSGVLPMQNGRITINNHPLTQLSTLQRARYLAVVPQARSLPGSFTVYQTVLLGRTPYLGWLGKSGSSDHDRVRWALARTNTEMLADRPVGELSGGEQQRVLLARALVQDAPVLLLDEPTTYLDLQHQSGLLNLVRELANEKNLAVLMVLHDLNLAGLYANRIALLENGRLHTIGRPKDVLTTNNLSAVFHVPIQVIPHPTYDTPLVLPDGIVNIQQPTPAVERGAVLP
ncbi:MAG: heme ABC transporter ATP-binding protein [Anaerolineales bacterium]|nr:heme ABC transporter ATP-binding protein [Anaerolineales bacterium]